MKNRYSNWKQVKKKFKKSSCAVCGHKNKLCLHHHTYQENDSLYVTLCKRCHFIIHFKNGKKLKMLEVRKRLKKLLTNKIKYLNIFHSENKDYFTKKKDNIKELFSNRNLLTEKEYLDYQIYVNLEYT